MLEKKMSVEKVNPIPDDSKDFEKSRATIAFSDFASKLMDLYCYVSLGKITWSDTQLSKCEHIKTSINLSECV